MGVVLGGATLTWWQLRRAGTTGGTPAAALETAAAYEQGFWTGAGVLVATGVGNLGSLAPYLPGAGTRWGTALAAKLLLVVALLALSVVRTLVVHRFRRLGDEGTEVPESTADVLRIGYAATALSLGALVALAEVLAHG
jgi:hypothetical protein